MDEIYFSDLGLNDDLLDGLYAMGFDKPTPIQQQAIPTILSGKDLIACAQTGTGKTAAYLLPLMQKIGEEKTGKLNTLIIAPTRELAQQIDQQVEGLGYFLGISSLAVYGGGDGNTWDQQQRALQKGADIIIATPGRLIAMLTAPIAVNMDSLRHLVLDEADRMLDMGFHEDILRIIHYLPKERQTLLFSATMPPKIRALTSRILNEPAEVNIAISKPNEAITQLAYMTYDNQKLPLLQQLLKEDHQSVIIFASTKEKVKEMEKEMLRKGLPVKAFHSDLEQPEREKIMLAFKNREVKILIGTDILSRGIDVDGISLVVNYDVPPDPEDYIHRIGRTARADRTGTAVTFINEKDQRRFFQIESLMGRDVPKLPLPEALGAAPEYAPEKKRPGGNGRGPRPQGKGGRGARKSPPSQGGPRPQGPSNAESGSAAPQQNNNNKKKRRFRKPGPRPSGPPPAGN